MYRTPAPNTAGGPPWIVTRNGNWQKRFRRGGTLVPALGRKFGERMEFWPGIPHERQPSHSIASGCPSAELRGRTYRCRVPPRASAWVGGLVAPGGVSPLGGGDGNGREVGPPAAARCVLG